MFLQSVKRVAIVQGRQRDDDWMVDYVEACLTGEALRWFVTLDDFTLGSWRTVRNAFLHQYAAPVVQRAPASAPAAALLPVQAPHTPILVAPKPSRYPLPSEVRADANLGLFKVRSLIWGVQFLMSVYAAL